ncbi:MAG: hypothetical protein VX201_00835 [Pseudomonadota bacterium]|nr:hypothetical protein [Pseudomonadota bacterium]
MKQLSLFALVALSHVVAGGHSLAQTATAPVRVEEFTAENAIMDTSIPFAIGASEARQSLRGAFGWPTFQEGLVEGVYFRFDPDGYARFSPNPRLDVDVFEVLCKSRTQECHGRKAGLTVFLTPQGQFQLALEGVIAGDGFYLSEGVSEIQIPERVLQPLDLQMENLLASSMELIVRRGGEEVSRHSLRGFVATTAYLRWVAARQDYAVLPRGWPVPNARANTPNQGRAQAASWQSPMPQPQVIAITQPAAPEPAGLSPDRIDAQLQELRDMVTELRRPPEVATGEDTTTALDEAARLEQLLLDLTDEVQLLREPVGLQVTPPDTAEVDLGHSPAMIEPQIGQTSQHRTTEKLSYLVEQLGLDLRTAVAVLELAEQELQDDGALVEPAEIYAPSVPTVSSQPAQPDLLETLWGEINQPEVVEVEAAAPKIEMEAKPPMPVTVREYRLLSDYFASAALPILAPEVSGDTR